MIYSALLSVHIIGACITGVAASYACVDMWYDRESSYRPVALILGALATFEILTGTTLSVISTRITSLSLCANIVAYLSIVFFVETLLFTRMKKISATFPVIRIIAPIATSLAFFIGAIAYGF